MRDLAQLGDLGPQLLDPGELGLGLVCVRPPSGLHLGGLALDVALEHADLGADAVPLGIDVDDAAVLLLDGLRRARGSVPVRLGRLTGLLLGGELRPEVERRRKRHGEEDGQNGDHGEPGGERTNLRVNIGTRSLSPGPLGGCESILGDRSGTY